MRTLLVAVLSLLVLSSGAEARGHRHAKQQPVAAPCTFFCFTPQNNNFFSGVRSIDVRMKKVNSRRERRARVVEQHQYSFPSFTEHAFIEPARAVAHGVVRVATSVGQVIGGRPSGCPHAYCGCGTSLHVFGKIVPELNLAVNWGRFPRATPAAGMVAYRSGHVFAIESVNEDGTVVAYDSNSGRGLTRIHTVSLRGYRVVNPHGA